MPPLAADLLRVLRSTWRVMWLPSVFLVSATATVLADVLIHALGAERGFLMVGPPQMAGLAVLAVVQFWIGACVIITALDHIRHEYLPGRPSLVGPVPALEAGLVSVAFTIAICGGLLLFIVPGVFLALRWSQAAPLILDGEDTWRTAGQGSAHLTTGKRTFILLVWLSAGAIVIATGWIAATIGDMTASFDLAWAPRAFDLGGRILTDTFSLALLGALYHDLQTHA